MPLAARATAPAETFLDVVHADLVGDPLAVMRRVYAFTPAAEAAQREAPGERPGASGVWGASGA